MRLSCRSCHNVRMSVGGGEAFCGIERPLQSDRTIAGIRHAASFCDELTIKVEPP